MHWFRRKEQKPHKPDCCCGECMRAKKATMAEMKLRQLVEAMWKAEAELYERMGRQP